MQGSLLERDTELAELGRVATDVVGGRGAVALLEGPAGIGKTALLEAVRAGAEREGIRILHARASELDRSYGFGVVHQLFEPALVAASQEERDELLGGAAARAEIVFSTGSSPRANPGTPYSTACTGCCSTWPPGHRCCWSSTTSNGPIRPPCGSWSTRAGGWRNFRSASSARSDLVNPAPRRS